jgi:hypothetical protein
VSVDVGQYADTLGAALSRDASETTTMAKQSKTSIPGLKDATLPWEGPFDTLAEAIIWPFFDQGVIFAWEYCPAGTGVVGTPKYTGSGFFTGFEVSSGVADANHLTSGLQVTGDVTRTIQ